MHVLLLSFDDIGKNFRLINYANSLSRQKGYKVTIFGPDISHFPYIIRNNPLIDAHFLESLNIALLSPLFYLIQIFFMIFKISSVDIIVAFPRRGIITQLAAYLISFIKRAKLVFDINDSMSVKMTSGADFFIHDSSRGSDSFLLNSFGLRFKSNRSQRQRVLNILKTPDSEYLIAALFKEDLARDIQTFQRACQFISGANIKATIIIFAPQRLLDKYASKFEDSMNVVFRYETMDSEVYPELLGACDLGIVMRNSGNQVSDEVLELYSCRVPMLVKECQGVKDYIAPGKNGMMFEDGVEFCKRIREVLIKKAYNLNDMQRYSEKHNQDWELTMMKIWTSICHPKIHNNN